MKKNIKPFCLLLALPLIAGATLMFTACGSEVDIKSVAEETSAVIESINSSEYFVSDYDVLVYQGRKEGALYKKGSLKGVIPQYKNLKTSADINSKITQKSDLGQLNSEYVKIRMVYDAVWAYSYKIFVDNANLITNLKTEKLDSKSQKAVENFSSSIKSFKSNIKTQEINIQNMKTTLYELGSSNWEESLAYNVLYNYEKEYKNFVRAGLDLAEASIEVVETAYEKTPYAELKSNEVIEQTEESSVNFNKRLSDKLSIKVLDAYFTFIVEEMGVVGYDSSTEVGSEFCQPIYLSYLDFVATLFNGISSESNYFETATSAEIDTLKQQEDLISNQFSDTKKLLSELNIENINATKNGDLNQLSDSEQSQMVIVYIFYQDVLNGYWKNYSQKIFRTGIIS